MAVGMAASATQRAAAPRRVALHDVRPISRGCARHRPVAATCMTGACFVCMSLAMYSRRVVVFDDVLMCNI